jgi:glutamyl-tRNA synthetase
MPAPVVRFAPSPTGRIHIGNARTALLNYLYARRHGGTFVLRFDDTDLERSREEYIDAIEADLAWLGLTVDLTLRQSRRFALYEAAADRLSELGRLYPCYESPEELDLRRKRQIARGLPPVYDRAALKLSPQERAALEAEGRTPHWRFKLDHRIVAWADLVRGDCHIDCGSLSDPVLRRADGSWLYTLPSVVDDVELGVSHIIRGEDHVTNTAVQLQLFELLGDARRLPTFAHHNLLTDASGEGLSKRSGALSIGGLREAGVEALAVAALAVLTGSSESVHPVTSLRELAQLIDFTHISRAAAKFDPADLHTLSARTLHILPFESVRDRLAAHDITGHKAEPFWLAVRGNLTTFLDVVDWWRVVDAEIEPVVEDRDFLRVALALLPAEPWDATTWSQWTALVKQETGRKGKALFHPLRLALTGRESGPELAVLLPLIGSVKASARLFSPSA